MAKSSFWKSWMQNKYFYGEAIYLHTGSQNIKCLVTYHTGKEYSSCQSKKTMGYRFSHLSCLPVIGFMCLYDFSVLGLIKLKFLGDLGCFSCCSGLLKTDDFVFFILMGRILLENRSKQRNDIFYYFLGSLCLKDLVFCLTVKDQVKLPLIGEEVKLKRIIHQPKLVIDLSLYTLFSGWRIL